MIREALTTGALAPMAAYSSFVLYKVVPSKSRPGKQDKFPCDYTGRVSDAHDRSIWLSAQDALAWSEYLGLGVGFVFSDDSPFWFFDIDGAFVDGQWSALAQQFSAAFNGAAVEVSQSGKGLHIFGTGQVPPHACKNSMLNLELYHTGRFCALTGINAIGNAGIDCTPTIAWLVANYFPMTADSGAALDWRDALVDGPCEEWRGSKDDDELIRRAMQSRSSASAFGGKASFADLWQADADALLRTYPDGAGGYDASLADRALAQHLAFWTGKDGERIKRLMRRSALVRDKWEREDYLPRTIGGACAAQGDVCKDKAIELSASVAAEPMPPITNLPKQTGIAGKTMLAAQDQAELFEGCVYIESENRVLVKGGKLLKPEAFRARFGHRTFIMDVAGEKVTKDAFEAFTQSQMLVNPSAYETCFKPQRPFGEITEYAGRQRANSFWPVGVRRISGDPTPFLIHLSKLIPIERDRQLLLYYMAALVQHQGVKFQWCPLIQGCEGNGKTLLSRCVAEAVGKIYTHWPRADQIAEKFNSWLFDKVFIGVEDIYTADQKSEVWEILKPMITGENLAKRAMNTDQLDADLCANFMLNSNFKDGVRKTKSDRRLGIWYTAQQCAEDLKRDGMDGDYFPKLYDWLRADGYAIVADLLHTLPIPDDMNPAKGLQRAPVTSSTDEAIEASLGSIEQELIEAIAQDKPGFMGGWISSMQVDHLLAESNVRRMSRAKKKQMIESLGYVMHPGLTDGRVDNKVFPDNAKPVLYIKIGHPSQSWTCHSTIAKAYGDAQIIFGKVGS